MLTKERSPASNLKHRLRTMLQSAKEEYETIDAIRDYNDELPACRSLKLETEAAIEMLNEALDAHRFTSPQTAVEYVELLKG